MFPFDDVIQMYSQKMILTYLVWRCPRKLICPYTLGNPSPPLEKITRSFCYLLFTWKMLVFNVLTNMYVQWKAFTVGFRHISDGFCLWDHTICLRCFALTCKLKWGFDYNRSLLQRLPSGNSFWPSPPIFQTGVTININLIRYFVILS